MVGHAYGGQADGMAGRDGEAGGMAVVAVKLVGWQGMTSKLEDLKDAAAKLLH